MLSDPEQIRTIQQTIQKRKKDKLPKQRDNEVLDDFVGANQSLMEAYTYHEKQWR